ncbi:MAG: hypothetical protein ACXWNQ_03520, partial [Anaerolineales bacterium]
PTLAYRVIAREIAIVDPVTGLAITAPHITWDEAEVAVTADQALRAAHNADSGAKSQRGEQDAVQNFLREALASNEWEPAREIIIKAAETGFSETQLKKARSKLGVVIEQRQGKWWWRLIRVQL